MEENRASPSGCSGASPGFGRAAILAWSLGALVVSLIAIAPLIAIATLAAQSSGNAWPHLIANVLPGALQTTLLLMLGVGTLTLVIGHRHRVARDHVSLSGKPGPCLAVAAASGDAELYHRLLLSRAVRLFRPAADHASQRLRLDQRKDYWFPDIRSLSGAIFFISAVLYPYVFVTARASFLGQSVCVLEVARTLGRSATATFWEVALPLARPALAAGVALALMETLNDIGAVSFFGVRTLTVAIYDTWLDRNSLAGAAQIAGVMLIFVFALLLIERASRAKQRFHHTTGKYRRLPEEELRGFRGALASLGCALPVLIGFVLPAGVLVHNAIAHLASGLTADFWEAAWPTA